MFLDGPRVEKHTIFCRGRFLVLWLNNFLIMLIGLCIRFRSKSNRTPIGGALSRAPIGLRGSPKKCFGVRKKSSKSDWSPIGVRSESEIGLQSESDKNVESDKNTSSPTKIRQVRESNDKSEGVRRSPMESDRSW